MREQARKRPAASKGKWLVAVVVLALVMGGVFEWRTSRLIGNEYRYNLVMVGTEKRVSFVSFNPVEKQVLVIELPSSLHIKSRSYGTYEVGNLYQLGEYEGQAGNFVRSKIQGFMRVPIEGFLETETWEGKYGNIFVKAVALHLWQREILKPLNLADKLILIFRAMNYDWRINSQEDLIKAGVLVQEQGEMSYSSERLKQFLESRVFDWSIGMQGLSVAVVNESGRDRLGNDIAEYLNNLGFDVISVRTGEGESEKTTLKIDENTYESRRELIQLLSNLFDWKEVEKKNIDEYRAEVVIYVGTDAEKLF